MIRRLKSLTLEVTDRCPLRCTYCYIQKKNRELPLEKAKEAVEKYQPEQVNISGGEPLLYRAIDELLDYLERRGINYTLSISGVVLKKKTAKKLEDRVVQLTIDGRPSYHNKMRPINSFYRTLETAKELKRLGARVYVATVLTNQNARDVKYVGYLSSRFAEVYRVIRLIPVRRELLRYLPTPKDVEVAVAALEDIEKYYGLKTESFWPRKWKYEKDYNRLRGLCPGYSQKLVVTPGGAVLPCEFARNLKPKEEDIPKFIGCPIMALKTTKSYRDYLFAVKQ